MKKYLSIGVFIVWAGLVLSSTQAQEVRRPEGQDTAAKSPLFRMSRGELVEAFVRDNAMRLDAEPAVDAAGALRSGMTAGDESRERSRRLASAALTIDPSMVPLDDLRLIIHNPDESADVKKQVL